MAGYLAGVDVPSDVPDWTGWWYGVDSLGSCWTLASGAYGCSYVLSPGYPDADLTCVSGLGTYVETIW